jgi:hypothetical protein
MTQPVPRKAVAKPRKSAVQKAQGPIPWRHYKNIQLHFLVDQPTHQRLLKLFEASGADSMGAYIRSLIKKEAESRGVTPE